jgi:diaminopimelate epimerase
LAKSYNNYNFLNKKMNPIKFCKFHGFGNDYVVIEASELAEVSDIGEFTKVFCHRNLGVGSDGIAILEKLHNRKGDFSCRIINPDGSEADFSGNGTRCAVAYAHYANLWSDENLKLITKSGEKNYQLTEKISQGHYWFDAEIGKPSAISSFRLKISDYDLEIRSLDVGNPVAVIFVEDFNDFDWRFIGKEVESHQKFKNRTNVVFVKVASLNDIEIRIWERGAGETSSSGTCSTAAAIAHLNIANMRGIVRVHAEGGTTEITWRDDDEILIKGRADLVFCGTWLE